MSENSLWRFVSLANYNVHSYFSLVEQIAISWKFFFVALKPLNTSEWVKYETNWPFNIHQRFHLHVPKMWYLDISKHPFRNRLFTVSLVSSASGLDSLQKNNMSQFNEFVTVTLWSFSNAKSSSSYFNPLAASISSVTKLIWSRVPAVTAFKAFEFNIAGISWNKD